MTVDPKDCISMDELYKMMFKKGFMKRKIVCMECGKVHHPNSEDFVSIVGNILIGLDGGVIGNNFDTDGRLFRINFFCRSNECLDKFMERLRKRSV